MGRVSQLVCWGSDMARHPKVTWDRLAAAIAKGRGSGHGDAYRPMLEVKRWNPSPVSVQVRKALPGSKRVSHFFSMSEWYLALLFCWLGAHVREQYPLWPWPHFHPSYGINSDLDSMLPWSEGMQAICAAAGIPHGTFIGTNIPYIWSMDLCVTIPWSPAPLPDTAFVSIKPLESERYQYVDPLDRGVEKLEAERRYAKSSGLRYFVGDRSLYPGHLLGQLDSLSGAAVLPQNHRWWAPLQDFLDRRASDLQRYPLTELVRILQLDHGLTKPGADFLIQHCQWNQIIDIDLSLYVDSNKCPIPGGRRLKAGLRDTLLEEQP